MTGNGYHLPVMVGEIMGYFAVSAEGVFVDGTVGGGGHARALLSGFPKRRLVGLDKDPDALKAAAKTLASFGGRFVLRQAGFEEIPAVLSALGERAAAVLLDLGVSSRQIDSPGRGFSFQKDGALDMRFDPRQAGSASDIVNQSPAGRLAGIFREYGEERRARKIALAVEAARKNGPVKTTAELARIVERAAGPDVKVKARVFQALRIEVNGELAALSAALSAVPDVLTPGGRFAVIAYHSLEDRMVKRAFQALTAFVDRGRRLLPGEKRLEPAMEKVSKKAVVPSADEVSANPRARSAKLRVVEKR